jgi:ABC-type uncharacterized transport system ATPase subunit
MMSKKNGTGDRTGVIEATLEFIKRDIGEIKSAMKEIREDFITRAEFEPVKRIVYGMVTLILTAVVGALIALVVQGGGM